VSAAAHPSPEQPTLLGSRRKLEIVGRSPAVDLAGTTDGEVMT
jgi:hypothetical protein